MASLEEAIVFMLLASLAVVATVEETREQCLQRLATCTDNERPVCGTNNVTYSSKCQLMRAQCQPTLAIVTIKHRGRCRNKIKPRSKCLQHLEFAKSRTPKANDKSWYIPTCEPDGSFAPVQCHENTGFCWCVDTNGQPVSNTTVRRKRNGKIRCIRHDSEKSATKRRSSLRGRGNKRNCNLSDKAIFNSNLIDKFHAEWVILHEGTGLHGAELDRVVLDWKFKDMDKNRDGQLDKTEYRDLRKLVKIFVKPKRCSKSFARACDINQDQHISSQEWADCLTRDGMNDEKPSGPDLDNSSSDRDDDEDDADDYDDLDDFPHPRRSPPPHGILQNGGSLMPGLQMSGEDSNERHDEEATDCLSDRQAVLNEHRASELYVPECTPDGRYKKIQCYKSVGYCWCVHEDTGKNIPGTSVQHEIPKCDQVPASTRPMKGCPEPKKAAFLKDLMDFLHSRMVAGTNDTNITGSESGWQAPMEEKAATWNFVVLDKNKNKVLERKEWKVFRALVSDKKQLRRCGKKLPRYCDVNNDQKISLSEWLDCLNAKRNTTQQGSTSNPRPASQRQGKNPLTSFLMDD